MSEVRRITVKCCGRLREIPSTLTFSKGAPECHRSDEFLEDIKLDVKPLIDIWSFGGVCSEAAVWVVLGTSGLDNYRHQRKQEICERGTTQDGSCFHDGEGVLDAVKGMHQRLLTMGEIRPGDHVTRFVLDHMVTYMLHEDPDMRDDAVKLWKKSKKALEEAEKKLEKFRQQINPRESYHAGGNTQDNGRITPITPPHGSSEAGQKSLDNTPHAHGPPPTTRPRHSSNIAASGWSPGPEQWVSRRSDTWHGGRNVDSDIASRSLDESPSPSIVNRPFKASPPVEERPELSSTASNEIPMVFEEPYPYTNGSKHSSSRGFNDEHQSAHDFSPPGTKTHARSSLPPPIRRSVPVPFRGNGTAFGTQVENAPNYSKLDTEPMGYQNNQTAIDIPSDKTSQKPPASLATFQAVTSVPPTSTPVELPVPPIKPEKPEKPHLSFDEAKKIRVDRTILPPEHQALLNDLKNRDHVSS